MKKKFYIIICLFICVILIKYFLSSYIISYKIKDFYVVEKASDKYIELTIKYNKNDYYFKYYKSRTLFKRIVKNISISNTDEYTCLTPKLSFGNSYSVCSNGTDLVSNDVAHEKNYNQSSKNDFKYYNNLEKNEYMLIWKYDGFYYMNYDSYKTINLFDKDRYSNDLMIQIDKYILFPSYTDDYYFNDFYLLDITTGKYYSIDTKYDINYDSYFTGIKNNNIYLFDNKDNRLYEINYKRKKVTIKGDIINGFIKYENGKKEKASLEDYTKNRITYFNKKPNNIENNYINENNYKLKIFKEEINYIDSINDKVYFLYEDELYRFNYYNTEVILHYFEFNFNNNKIVYVYNK